MKPYLDSLKSVLENGETRTDRTGTGTISEFGVQTRYDLREGFPAVTTKKLAWKSVVSELLWFLEGSTDERRLAEIHYGRPTEELVGKTTIWTANADAQGKALGYPNTDTVKELGPVYGAQWRKWGYDDQVNSLVEAFKIRSDSRRLILSAWNVDVIPSMALPPCHVMSQYRVSGEFLDCVLTQRSSDRFLGECFNVASYALLMHLFAEVSGLIPRFLTHQIGDAHIYSNHVNQVKEQLSREPRKLPTLVFPRGVIRDLSVETIKGLKVSDFVLEGYDPYPPIKAEMAV